MKPLLLRHYRIRFEPPHDGGEGALVFTSEGSRVVVRGSAFPQFLEHVVPLLDGRATVDEITGQVSEIFAPDDLERMLALLAEHGVVVDAERAVQPAGDSEWLGPELAFLHEVAPDPALVVERLRAARVTVVGLGGAGAVAATALAAANVGHLRCVDDSAVSPADPYLAQLFSRGDVGSRRAEVTRERILAVNPATSVEILTDPLLAEADVVEATRASDFVLACLDPGLAATTDRLNAACLAHRTPWSMGTAGGFEGVVGPTVIPYETACYRCYQARLIAGREDPREALAELRAREASATDASRYRENLAFGAGIVGNLLGLQAFQALTGVRPRTAGRILVVDFLTSTMSEHVVLRKPWCPACFAEDEP